MKSKDLINYFIRTHYSNFMGGTTSIYFEKNGYTIHLFCQPYQGNVWTLQMHKGYKFLGITKRYEKQTFDKI